VNAWRPSPNRQPFPFDLLASSQPCYSQSKGILSDSQ
jgi:hypothetical protein